MCVTVRENFGDSKGTRRGIDCTMYIDVRTQNISAYGLCKNQLI